MKTKKTKSKANKRSNSKYPALNKQVNKKSLDTYIDYDYLDQLNDTEKGFLNKFTAEEYIADFRHPKKINKTKKSRRKLYQDNNVRNRDLYNKVNKIRDELKEDSATYNVEDTLNNLLDIKIKLNKNFIKKAS